MADIQQFTQFPPNPDKPDEPGRYGWGFQIGKLRVVMYCPPEFDDLDLGNGEQNAKKTAPHQSNGDGEDDDGHEHGYAVDTKALRRSERRSEKKQKKKKKEKTAGIGRDEHGPAHVHVINMNSYRESKFELIEGVNGYDVIPMERKDSSKKEPLKEKDVKAIIPLLQANAAQFVQLWHEAYIDHNKKSNYVTRVSELFNDHEHMERLYFEETPKRERGEGDPKWEKRVKLTRGSSETDMPFDDYVALLKEKRGKDEEKKK